MFAFHKVLVAKHEECEDIIFPSLFPYYVFRASWYHFLERLDIDYEAAFKCPNCTAEPSTIICDATSLSFRRELLQSTLQVEESEDSSCSLVLDGWYAPCLYICTLTAPIVRLIVQNYILLCSSIVDRVFIPNSKCRSLLTKYAATGWDNAALQLFGEDDMTELKQLLSVHSSSICSLLESWSFPCPSPSKYVSLIKTLATASPACALLLPSQVNLDLMDKLCSGYNVRSDPATWSQLQKTIPILFRLIVDLDTTFLPKEFIPVLSEIVQKSKRPFEVVPPENDVAISHDNSNSSCSFYPHLPRRRSRRQYKADLNRKTSTCCKVYRGHPSLLPGIFTAFCPHGIVTVL